jgi:hypothetical protein
MSSSRLVQLAESVIKNAKTFDAYLQQHDLPAPSFDADGPADFGISTDSPHVEQARVEAIEAAIELADLLQGPITFLRPIVRYILRHECSSSGSFLSKSLNT